MGRPHDKTNLFPRRNQCTFLNAPIVKRLSTCSFLIVSNAPAIRSDLTEPEKKLDILLSRVETPDSKNYWLMAATYSSREFAESEAIRISNIIKERNPEKYPDGITFRVMELWRIMDSEKNPKSIKDPR